MTDDEWVEYNRLEAEYNAKASMLGMNYNPMGHYFFDKKTSLPTRKRYDADTMEELSDVDAEERRHIDYGHVVLNKKARTHVAQVVTSGGNDGY